MALIFLLFHTQTGTWIVQTAAIWEVLSKHYRLSLVLEAQRHSFVTIYTHHTLHIPVEYPWLSGLCKSLQIQPLFIGISATLVLLPYKFPICLWSICHTHPIYHILQIRDNTIWEERRQTHITWQSTLTSKQKRPSKKLDTLLHDLPQLTADRWTVNNSTLTWLLLSYKLQEVIMNLRQKRLK